MKKTKSQHDLPLKEIIKLPIAYEALISSIDGIVWVANAKTFQFLFVSQQVKKILGYSPEEWLREPQFWQNHIHPEDRDWAIDFCIVKTQEMVPHNFEYRIISATNQIVWLRDFVTVIEENNKPAMICGVMVNITDQKQAENSLIEQNKLYNLLANYSSDGITLINAEGKVVFISPAHLKNLGYEINEVVGIGTEEILERIHPEDRIRIAESIKRSRSSGELINQYEYRALKKTGEYIWV